MKILDEKGRLFGKLNLIDLLVLLLAVAAAAVFLYGRLKPQGTQEPVKTYELTYEVQVSALSPAFAETVRQYVDPEQGLADQIFSTDTGIRFQDAYVVDFTTAPHVEYVATSDGEVKRVESSGDDQRLDGVMTIRATITDPITNLVGSQQVRVGAVHYVKTTHFEISGLVQSVERRDL